MTHYVQIYDEIWIVLVQKWIIVKRNNAYVLLKEKVNCKSWNLNIRIENKAKKMLKEMFQILFFFWIMYEINGKKIALGEVRIPRNLLCILYLERKDVFNIFDALITSTWKRDVRGSHARENEMYGVHMHGRASWFQILVYFLINKTVIFFFKLQTMSNLYRVW